MTTWFTSDNHFSHSAILGYCDRPFSCVEEMDETMIERWNQVVKSKDDIYHLGDFSLITDISNYVRRLNGRIRLVPGGHDKRWIKRHKNSNKLTVIKPLVSLTFKEYKVDGRPLTVVCCHYAMRSWPRSYYGSLHCFGHSHGRLPGEGRSMDIGVDSHNFYPVSLEEVAERLSAIPYKKET